MEVRYRKNEWLIAWVDWNGVRQIIPFDTREEAETYLVNHDFDCLIGMMTTAFYNRYVEKVID